MLKPKKLNWKICAALLIVFVSGGILDRSFLYIIQQNQTVSDTQKQSTDESIEASADESVAQYTEVLAWFTVILAVVGIWQGYFSAQQMKLSREQFNLSVKRPWLFISGASDLFEGRFQDEIWTYADYSVVNHGEAPAIIEAVQCQFIYSRGHDEQPLNVNQNHQLLVSPIIGPGESVTKIQESIPPWMLTDDKITYLDGRNSVFAPKVEPDTDLIFVVQIQYRGISTNGHESSAMWRWDFRESHFVAIGGETHNYAK